MGHQQEPELQGELKWQGRGDRGRQEGRQVPGGAGTMGRSKPWGTGTGKEVEEGADAGGMGSRWEGYKCGGRKQGV